MDTAQVDMKLVISNDRLEAKSEGLEAESELGLLCNLGDFFSGNIDFPVNITILDLSNCKIRALPYSVQEMKLKEMILSNNEIVEVPSCLYSGLKRLELLDLSHNQIRTFDIEPACYMVLKVLKLASNFIYNVPQWILSSLSKNLVDLDYSHNEIVNLSTKHTIRVQKITIVNSHLMDTDIPFFRGIETLQFLDLGNDSTKKSMNVFNDIDQLFVKPKWTNMRVLKLNNLTISIIPEGIFWISTLVELYLTNSVFSWVPSDIKYLTNLEKLDVSNNKICTLPKSLLALPNLKEVFASHNAIYSIDLPETSQLRVLDLYSNLIEEFPEHISEIECVDLELNCFETPNSLTYLATRNRLRVLISGLERYNGVCAQSPPWPDSGSSTSEYSAPENNHSVYFSESDENWDEEPQQVKQYHPEITPSDDEWQGKEEMKKVPLKKPTKTRNYIDPNECLFCDAD